MTASAIRGYSLVQPAVIVRDLDTGVDRMHELFGAVPSERNDDHSVFANAVYAFGNNTHLELLDGMHESHTRWRFLERRGPGLYMLCVDLTNEQVDRPADVEEEITRHKKRIVQKDTVTENIVNGWHLHPHDTGNLLILLALKRDTADNRDWAGLNSQEYVRGNTRVINQVRGVVARSTNPAAESATFAEVGLAMRELSADGRWGWEGATGTVFELWPEDAWPGERPESYRDYALLVTAHDPEAVLHRTRQAGLAMQRELGSGRWLTDVDSVLGVRLIVERADS